MHETHEPELKTSDGHNMPHGHQGHDRHAGHSVAMFRDKFWLSFALTIPTVIWSPDVQHWLGYSVRTATGAGGSQPCRLPSDRTRPRFHLCTDGALRGRHARIRGFQTRPRNSPDRIGDGASLRGSDCGFPNTTRASGTCG